MASDAEVELLAIAETQYGLFTTTQADALGFTEAMRRSRLARKTIRRLHKNVFVFAGHALEPAAVHLAAVFAAGPTARASHRAGAWLWEMTPYEQKAEVTVPTYARIRVPNVRLHRTNTALLPPATRLGVPTTTAEETLLDLGAVLNLENVQNALDRGIARKLVTPMSALAELNRRGHTGVRGTAALRSLLDQAGITGSHHPSVLEAKTRRLIQKAGLPQPECELIVGKNGEYRLDFVWPELMLAVEVDGWMYHSSTAAFHANKSRKNSLTIEGYSIIEYTWIHINRTPATVIRELQAAYAGRRRLLTGQMPLPVDAD